MNAGEIVETKAVPFAPNKGPYLDDLAYLQRIDMIDEIRGPGVAKKNLIMARGGFESKIVTTYKKAGRCFINK